MGCQFHFFFVMTSLNLSILDLLFLFKTQTYSKKSESFSTISKGTRCECVIECFIIVSQGLSREVHLVTGCLAMPMLLRPVRTTAKSFKWNMQVQKIPSPSPTAFRTKIVYSTQFGKKTTTGYIQTHKSLYKLHVPF